MTSRDFRQEDLDRAIGDRYTVQRQLGRGGMATVYLAEDVKHGRQVAIKVLHPELAVVLGAERFLREIEIAARLSHPHVLTLHDSGQAGHYLYYVMPFIEGESLRGRLDREGALPVEEALQVAREVASALDYAHARGVVHRDIKPENILLSQGYAVVADFGIAKAVDSAGREALTQTGLGVGSPLYMSPEQAMGGRDVDLRTDLYSLGCVFFEMLAGRPPFTGETVLSLVAQHATDPVPSLRTLRPDAPAACDAIAQRAMAKDPKDRFASAGEMFQALTGEIKVKLPAERRSAPTAVQATGAPPPASIAVLPFVDLSPARDQEYLCDGIAEEVMGALTNVGGLRVASRGAAFAFRGQEVDARTLGRKLNVATVLEGSVQRAADRLRVTARLTNTADGFQVWADRYARDMTDVFAIQEEIAGAIVDAMRVKVSGAELPAMRRPTANHEAYQLYLKGRYFWNRRHQGGLQKAMECYRGAIELDPAYAQPYVGLGDAFSSLASYDYMAPKQAYGQAGPLIRKALALDPSLAEAQTSLAWVTAQSDLRWEDALQGFSAAAARRPDYALTHAWWGIVLIQVGRVAEGLERVRHSVELEPLDMPFNASAGWMQVFAGRPDEAERQLRAALDLDPSYVASRAFLGMALVAAGRDEAAVPELEQARAIPGVVALLGLAHARAGREREARAALAELEQAPVVNPYSVALIHLGLGAIDEAFAWLAKAVEARTFLMNFSLVNPLLDPIRGDPRFPPLIEALHLPAR